MSEPDAARSVVKTGFPQGMYICAYEVELARMLSEHERERFAPSMRLEVQAMGYATKEAVLVAPVKLVIGSGAVATEIERSCCPRS